MVYAPLFEKEKNGQQTKNAIKEKIFVNFILRDINMRHA
jgi:hypothetical protein